MWPIFNPTKLQKALAITLFNPLTLQKKSEVQWGEVTGPSLWKERVAPKGFESMSSKPHSVLFSLHSTGSHKFNVALPSAFRGRKKERMQHFYYLTEVPQQRAP